LTQRQANRLEPCPAPEAPLQTPSSPNPTRLYQQVAERILELIQNGEFKAGQSLPSERTLAERLEVSRATIREAIIALEIGNRVEVRGGSGIYVKPAAQAMPIHETGPGPFELLRARHVFEGEVAAAAAESAKPADIDRLHESLNELARTLDDRAANDLADRAFHFLLAEATGNSAMSQVVSLLWDQGRGEAWSQMDAHFHTSELRHVLMEDHRKIFLAIVERSPRAARKAMRDHIDRIQKEFARSWRALNTRS